MSSNKQLTLKSQKACLKQSNHSPLDYIADKIGSQHLAYIMTTLGTSLFALGFLYSNEHNFNVCQTFLSRSIVMIVLNFFITRYYGMDISFKDPVNMRILMTRNVTTTVQNVVYTISQFYLTQPIVQTLNTSSIIFVFLLDYFINHVTITRKQFFGVIFGVIGVLLTVNGEFIISWVDPKFQMGSDFKNYATKDPIVKMTVALVFIISNIFWAYGQIIVKQLNQVNAIQINLHLGWFYLFVTGLFYPSMVSKPVQISSFIKGIFFGGLVTTIGQMFFIGAIKMSKNTGVLTMFSFVSVIVGYFVSVFKYNEAINPVCIFGAGFICVGLFRIMIKEKVEETVALKN